MGLDYRSRGLGSYPGLGHCVKFLGKRLKSQLAKPGGKPCDRLASHQEEEEIFLVASRYGRPE